MSYNPQDIIESYHKNRAVEDRAEKDRSLRTEIPREFIKRYLKSDDEVLDAGGGTGINAIMMAQRCKSVTLLDLTPGILEIAAGNIQEAGLSSKIDLLQGDITDLSYFEDSKFSFVVCVGDAISYVLDKRYQALSELVRVAKPGSILIVGCDSKFGFLRLNLAVGNFDEALAIHARSETTCGMGPRTHLYTVDEMRGLLEGFGCQVLEIASTPSLADSIDVSQYKDGDSWDALRELELDICTHPELLGIGTHLLFVVRKTY